jgi:hypothetical protein
MPTVHRIIHPDRQSTAPATHVPRPHRNASLPTRARRLVAPTPMNPAWPATIASIAAIVFTVFWAQTTLMMALLMALSVLVVGGILLTLVSGTAWITQLRRSIGSRIFGDEK